MKRQIVMLALVLVASMAMTMQPALAQFPTQFGLLVLAPQEVDAVVDGDLAKLRVGAEIRIHPDGTAQGTFRVGSREGRSVLRAFAGEATFDDDGTLIRADVSFMPRDGDDGLIVFITPVVDGAGECDIFILQCSCIVGAASSVIFEADAQFRVVGPSRR